MLVIAVIFGAYICVCLYMPGDYVIITILYKYKLSVNAQKLLNIWLSCELFLFFAAIFFIDQTKCIHIVLFDIRFMID